MTNNFFDLDNSALLAADQRFEEEDDTEYDALNNETFGEDLPSTDWEEVHERLTSTLEKRSFDEETDDLSERIASYILDDEGEEVGAANAAKPAQKMTSSTNQDPLKWLLHNVTPQTTGEQASKSVEERPGMQGQGASWWEKQKLNEKILKLHPKVPAKILTVEELEEKMRQEAASAAAAGPSPCPFMDRAPHLDDREQNIPHHMQNGHYARGRGAVGGARRRFRPDGISDQPYHAVHHPFPPYPSSSGMMRPPPPRHAGQMYRQNGRRYMGSGMGPGRGTRPMNHHSYYPPQQPNYRRGGPPPSDVYAGLMTAREKQWLSSIQMMQLNTANPQQDDYYYWMFQQKPGTSGRKGSGNINSKTATPKCSSSSYAPLQFENSLGKLQIGSVTAPRKIIDMDCVENFDYNTKQADRKLKQILLEIEEIYISILKIEDIRRQIDVTSGRMDLEVKALQDKCMSILLADGKLLQIMSIRKGKKAIFRLMSTLMVQNQLPLIYRLLVDLAPITRKDSEHMLLTFLPYIRFFISSIGLNTLIDVTKNYDNQFLLSNKFTVSVMANMIERAEQIKNDCESSAVEGWNMFLVRLVKSTGCWEEIERPVVAVDRSILVRHLASIAHKVLPHELSSLVRTLQSTTSARVGTPACVCACTAAMASARGGTPTMVTSARGGTPTMVTSARGGTPTIATSARGGTPTMVTSARGGTPIMATCVRGGTPTMANSARAATPILAISNRASTPVMATLARSSTPVTANSAHSASPTSTDEPKI